MPLAVLSVVSEAFPLVKTGGLADVAGALPPALAPEGVAVRTLLPGYPEVLEKLGPVPRVAAWPDFFGGEAGLLAGHAGGLDLLVIDAPHLYDRTGGPYVGPDGKDWPDNGLRFAALAWAGAAIARGAVPDYRPAVVHAHDWQAGLVPAYLQFGEGRHVPTVMTVHNLAFQGQFPRESLAAFRLSPDAYTMDGVEYYDTISFLKGGLALADRITTVSPRYAIEARTPEFGMGLDGLLRQRAALFSGILNGIDTAAWDPATDPRIAAPFDAARLADREANRAALRARMNLAPDTAAPLFGVVSRLTLQKGIDVLVEALPGLVAAGGQLVLVGTGDAPLHAALEAAARAHPGRIAAHIGFDEDLAHQVQAGCDAILVPSRFEPCGLTQLCALRYGAIPVVSRVGGLADSVTDAADTSGGNGIQFSPVTPEALAGAIGRTLALWHDRDAWRSLQRRAMATDVGWTRAARHYAALYRSLVA
jgi:starch synthase